MNLTRPFVLACALGALTSAGAASLNVQYLGQKTLPTGTQALGTELGGLSGIDYNPATGGFVAIADDRSQINPARYYNLSLNYDLGGFNSVTVDAVTTLLRPDGTAFPALSLDPESIRIRPGTGKLVWTSEGEKSVPRITNPFVREMNADGTYVGEFSTPSKYFPTPVPDTTSGIRNNLAFESQTFSKDGTKVYTATENALYQDGPAATTANGTWNRVLSFDATTGAAGAEYAYLTDAVVDAPVPAGSFATVGLVELLALSDTKFLALERSFSTGVGNAIRLYEWDITGADDVSGIASLNGASFSGGTKTLIIDLADLGIVLDNVEGMTFGPDLANGNRSLVLVSDNNFSPTQFTQFIAFEVTSNPVPEASTWLAGGIVAVGALGVVARRRVSR